MSVTTQNGASFASPSIIGDATPGDYFALLKPRVMSLVMWTALAGLLCAPTPVNPIVGFAALLAIVIRAHAQLRIACLDRRMDLVPANHRVRAQLADVNRIMVDRMAGSGDQLNHVG